MNPSCNWKGEFKAYHLDFHHIDKSSKSFNLGSASVSIQKLIEEISKCTIVCANCHRDITWGLLDSSNLPLCKINETA